MQPLRSAHKGYSTIANHRLTYAFKTIRLSSQRLLNGMKAEVRLNASNLFAPVVLLNGMMEAGQTGAFLRLWNLQLLQDFNGSEEAARRLPS